MFRLKHEYSGFRFLIAGILALFPLLSTGFRHAAGVLMVLTLALSLVALHYLPRRSLSKDERLVIVVVVAFFISTVASSFSIGWDENAWRGLGIQLRYLCFIPIYLMFRAMRDPLSPFVIGLSLGGCILGLQSIAEVWFEGLLRAEGPYNSPGFLGIHALLTLLVCQYAYLEKGLVIGSRLLILVGALSACVAVVLSGSRSTYITALLLVLVLPMLRRDRNLRVISLSLLSLLILSGIFSELFINQVRNGVWEIKVLLSTSEDLDVLGTVAHRVDMWFASILIVADFPLFGVGWRNFSTFAEPFISQYHLSPVVAATPHPHSAYFNAMASHGLVGLSAMLLLWIVPFFVAWKNQTTCQSQATLVQIFVICFAINSLNEGGTFIYNNTVSIYFFTFAVLFATLNISAIRQAGLAAPKV